MEETSGSSSDSIEFDPRPYRRLLALDAGRCLDGLADCLQAWQEWRRFHRKAELELATACNAALALVADVQNQQNTSRQQHADGSTDFGLRAEAAQLGAFLTLVVDEMLCPDATHAGLEQALREAVASIGGRLTASGPDPKRRRTEDPDRQETRFAAFTLETDPVATEEHAHAYHLHAVHVPSLTRPYGTPESGMARGGRFRGDNAEYQRAVNSGILLEQTREKPAALVVDYNKFPKLNQEYSGWNNHLQDVLGHWSPTSPDRDTASALANAATDLIEWFHGVHEHASEPAADHNADNDALVAELDEALRLFRLLVSAAASVE